MRLTVPEIDCSEGFTPENDIFNRKQFSIQLENIIENSDDDNLVIALNDKWGNGKTTFLKMWEAEIAKEGANKQVISSQADSLIKISRIWADFFPANNRISLFRLFFPPF
ncbi:P-loop NTPase fold protein, partial [Klebsiella pneumoniae]